MVTFEGLVMIAESAYAEFGLYPRPETIEYAAECGLVYDTYDEAEEFIKFLADAAADANEMEF